VATAEAGFFIGFVDNTIAAAYRGGADVTVAPPCTGRP